MKTIRIALFDDDQFVLASLKIVFEGHKNITIAGAYTHANDLEANISASNPDLVLMDIGMPGTDGIEAVKIIRKHFDKLPVLMLTQHDEEDMVIKSISAGANGYLLKTTPGEQMIERIEELFSIDSRINPESARKFLDMFMESFALRTSNESTLLEDLEKKVLTLLEHGKNYAEIAGELNLSQKEVKEHIRKIYEKLNVSSVSGAIAIAMNQHQMKEE